MIGFAWSNESSTNRTTPCFSTLCVIAAALRKLDEASSSFVLMKRPSAAVMSTCSNSAWRIRADNSLHKRNLGSL